MQDVIVYYVFRNYIEALGEYLFALLETYLFVILVVIVFVNLVLTHHFIRFVHRLYDFALALTVVGISIANVKIEEFS